MYTISDLLMALLFAALILFWWVSMQARQNAREAAKSVCQRNGVQLIDDTVVRVGLRLRRDAQGRMGWQRDYHFEFSTDGSQRYHGAIKMQGRRIVDLAMEAYAVQDETDANVYRLPTRSANTRSNF